MPRQITFPTQGPTELERQFEPRLSGSRAEPKLKTLVSEVKLQYFWNTAMFFQEQKKPNRHRLERNPLPGPRLPSLWPLAWAPWLPFLWPLTWAPRLPSLWALAWAPRITSPLAREWPLPPRAPARPSPGLCLPSLWTLAWVPRLTSPRAREWPPHPSPILAAMGLPRRSSHLG